MYYTKNGKLTFVPQTDEQRLAVWVETMSDWKLIKVREPVKDRRGKLVVDKFGRPLFREVEKVVGTGIAKPTKEELDAVYAKPCRYRRAARAQSA
jgi:hypothetical protein